MQPPNDTVTEAIEAWNRRFVVPHVKVQRRDPDPFVVGNRLGSGGVGEVYECEIEGVPVALKRIYTKYHTEAIFAEVNIMRQMVEKRHRHIVQLIGSYEKRHSNSFELGLLIWPVAICDLAALLQDVRTVHWHVYGGGKEKHEEEDIVYAVETLARLESKTSTPDNIKNSETECFQLLFSTLHRLQSSVGCIASAVKWLHNCHIRHKDLKPSQILFSASGVWLSDFGWSKDVSELTCSATVGGKTTTPKYLAPERALNQPCGRPEDIFSLGCIFLEIGYHVFRKVDDNDEEAPWFQPGWLFSNNVEEAISFAEASAILLPEAGWLRRLVIRMLNQDPALRPMITEVVQQLTEMSVLNGICCRPKISRIIGFRRIIAPRDAEFRELQSTNHQTDLVPKVKRKPVRTYAHTTHTQSTPDIQSFPIQDPAKPGYERIPDDRTTENATKSKTKPLPPLPAGRHSHADDELEVLPPRNYTYVIPTRPGSLEERIPLTEANVAKAQELLMDRSLDKDRIAKRVMEKLAQQQQQQAEASSSKIRKSERTGRGELLMSPKHHRRRSFSRERITKRVMEKLAQQQQQQAEASSSNIRKSERTGRGELASPRRSSRRHRAASRGEVLDLTNETESDSITVKSGPSNPKLLATVEDAIKRLILPELNSLREENRRSFLQDDDSF
jgi:serine/threonine protein kinase